MKSKKNVVCYLTRKRKVIKMNYGRLGIISFKKTVTIDTISCNQSSSHENRQSKFYLNN